jgi:hypothetical protein
VGRLIWEEEAEVTWLGSLVMADRARPPWHKARRATGVVGESERAGRRSVGLSLSSTSHVTAGGSNEGDELVHGCHALPTVALYPTGGG